MNDDEKETTVDTTPWRDEDDGNVFRTVAGTITPPSPSLTSPTSPGRTVLPRPVARAVSLATTSTCLAIKAGTLAGSFGFDVARFASVSGLELGRGILGGILSRAGSRVVSRSSDQISRDEAESILETSLAALHHGMTQAVFWTTAGFELTSTTASTISGVAQLLFSSLDQLLGSNDSSRAIASIITLIRREFQNPASGSHREQVGVMDLALGLCAMAFLQHSCRKSTEEEGRRLGYEEIIWDVVVLNDGERVDVPGDALGTTRPRSGCSGISRHHSRGSLQSDATITRPIVLQTMGQGESVDNSDDDDLPEISLQKQIMQSLPPETTVSISTSVVTTKTITVDVSGPGTPQLKPPPGVHVVEERAVTSPSEADSDADAAMQRYPSHSSSPGAETTNSTPKYRVVYRVDRNKLKSTTLRRCDDDAASASASVSRPEVREAEEVVAESSKDVKDPHVAVPLGGKPPSIEEDMPPPPPPKPNTLGSSARPRTISPELSMTRGQAYVPRGAPGRAGTGTGTGTGTTPVQRIPASRLPTQTGKTQPAPPQQVHEANQKRQRKPLPSPEEKTTGKKPSRQNTPIAGKFLPKKAKHETPTSLPGSGGSGGSGISTERKGGLRQALRIGSGQSLSHLWNKDHHSHSIPSAAPLTKKKNNFSTSMMTPRAGTGEETNRPLSSGKSNSSTSLASIENEVDEVSRTPSRTSFISIHERTRDSIVSQTDTYSIHSTEDVRPPSPLIMRTEVSGSTTKTRSEKELEVQNNDHVLTHDAPKLPKARAHEPPQAPEPSQPSPSLYNLGANDSQTSLVLSMSSFYQRSAYSNTQALNRLRRTGMVEGTFPRFHILRNITRYARFSSASYGSSFMKFMGISKEMPLLHVLDETHADVKSFAHHTESKKDSILLASFVDPQGGSDSTGSTNTGLPLVHYLSVDHQSKAVVLACRGTLGFEDVLADMMCDYDDLVWRGKSYKVHKGIHASARRLLYGGDGRVLLTLKEALDEFDDYGLVLCGHSLGGGVTALLGVMLSEPTSGTDFITSAEPHNRRLLTDGSPVDSKYTHVCLPSGRPVHVYAYGPPGTMSSSLRQATRGLITTVVQGNDLVPYLSLGVLHDFQAVALAFKNDTGTAKSEIKARVWQAFQVGLADRWYANGAHGSPSSTFSSTSQRGDLSGWAHSTLSSLRAAMVNEKLLPPGEVFRVESTRVLRRDAFVRDAEDHIGRPARRIVLRYVRDVDARFREARLAATMLMDHSPGRYEDALNWLKAGVSEPGM